MPFPVAAVALGAVARGVAGVAVRGAARGAMTTARVGAKGVKGGAKFAGQTALMSSLSSSQFSGSGTSPSLNISGPPVHEMLGKTPE